MKVLGIDSAEASGYALITRLDDGTESLGEHGVLPAGSGAAVEAAATVLASLGPDLVVVEEPAIEDRLAKGQAEYGDRSLLAAPSRLVREIEEELLDVSAWSFLAWRRVRGLRKRSRS